MRLFLHPVIEMQIQQYRMQNPSCGPSPDHLFEWPKTDAEFYSLQLWAAFGAPVDFVSVFSQPLIYWDLQICDTRVDVSSGLIDLQLGFKFGVWTHPGGAQHQLLISWDVIMRVWELVTRFCQMAVRVFVYSSSSVCDCIFFLGGGLTMHNVRYNQILYVPIPSLSFFPSQQEQMPVTEDGWVLLLLLSYWSL